jgi:hypothetical protein
MSRDTFVGSVLIFVLIFGCVLPSDTYFTEQKSVCLFNVPFSCSKEMPQVYNKDGVAYVQITLINMFGKNVKIHGISCVEKNFEAPSQSTAIEYETTLESNGNATYGPINCLDKTGKPLRLQSNAKFNGKIVVWYNYENDAEGIGTRFATASLITTVK